MSEDELGAIGDIDDAADRALAAHQFLARLRSELEPGASRIRGRAVAALHDQGWSWQRIADLLGIDRSRAAQIGREWADSDDET